MRPRTYTFRISVSGEQSPVKAEIRDPQDVLQGRPNGRLRFEAYRERVEALSLKGASAGSEQRALTREEIRELGESLFNSLFDDELRVSFLTWYNTVVHGAEERLLRVELDIDEASTPRLATLPWEFMRVPDNQMVGTLWLATAPRLIFSRTRDLYNAARPIQLEPGENLRVALAVAAPRGLTPPKYEELWHELQMMASERQEIELLDLIDLATRRTIDDALAGKPHIFHFIGHGRLREGDDRHGEIAIVDAHPPYQPRWVDAQQFGSLFTRYRPGVVVLQACEGAAGSPSRAFVSVASQVVRQNIPVVAAMQYAIGNRTASDFSREFYRRLAQGRPVDEAAQEGRYGISDFHETRAFATPVLFMRVRHGQIFSMPEEPTGDGGDSQARDPIYDSEEPILNRVRRALARCGPFESDEAVSQVFATTPKLRVWQYSVPSASSKINRVDALMGEMLNRFTNNDENALVLFMRAVSERLEGGRCQTALAHLAEELDKEVEPPTW